MATIEIKVIQNDKLYDLNFTLQDSAGAPVNLTNANSINFKVQKADKAALKFTGAMSVVNAAQGTCKYNVQAGDFDETGKYYAEVEVVFASGQIQTFTDILIIASPELPKT